MPNKSQESALNARQLTSIVVPLILRGAQAEHVLRVVDVVGALADANRPCSTGTAHNIIQAEAIDAHVAVILLERMSLDQIAYGAARAAGGTFRRAGNGTGNAVSVAAGMVSDLAGVLGILSDGTVEAHDLGLLLKRLAQVRDEAAGLIERFGGPR